MKKKNRDPSRIRDVSSVCTLLPFLLAKDFMAFTVRPDTETPSISPSALPASQVQSDHHECEIQTRVVVRSRRIGADAAGRIWIFVRDIQ